MKMNSTWSKKDWEIALKKVWKSAKNFDEILDFGLENNFITNSDIIHASDIYKDPNKEYDDDELREIIKNSNIYDLMRIIQEEYSLDDIIEELPSDEILENISDDDLLDKLENSWVLERHDDDIRAEYHNDVMTNVINELEIENNEHMNNLHDASADDLHTKICDIIGVGYYDQEAFNKGLRKLIDKLNKNSYGIKYE